MTELVTMARRGAGLSAVNTSPGDYSREPLLRGDSSEEEAGDHGDYGVLGQPGRGGPLPHIINADENPPHHIPHPSTPYVYLLTLLSAIGGFLFGYDTGVVSGAMILVRDEFHLNSLWQEMVVSITIGTAAVFAFLGGFLNDRWGRKPVILISSFVFTLGAIVLGTAYNRIMLLAGRATLGIGIGLASMTVPVYIAENAPSHLRGRMVTLNNVFITGGQLCASIVDGIFSYNKHNGWRYMLGLAAVPSAVQFAGFIFMPESARWLVSQGRVSQAGAILQKIRGTSDVNGELEEIRSTHAEAEAAQAEGGSRSSFLRALTTPHVRRALILGCGLQLFQQICGINTVMYYSATIIKMSGVKSASMAIWLSALTAGVNFGFTFLGLYLVERIGRRLLTLCSIAGVMFSLALLAVAFQLAASRSPHVTFHETQPNATSLCDHLKSCDNCISSPDCGYCFVKSSAGPTNGSCVPSLHDKYGNPISNAADFGRCSKDSDVPDMEWAFDYCPTSIAWVSTFGLVLYLAFFAPGMGPMPWTVNSEIYPLWARSTGNSLSTATNWVFNLLISMTFLTLTEVLTKYGAFWLYTSFAFIGFIFLFVFLPETRGRSLEQVEELFRKPIC